ncbi:MAG TPA: hypothetical protein VE553_10945 [Candidatus Binatia bacterium]|jgi:hypothetical protein|nr:hypothetical protein [Candidatus Binatia bacterium]
MNDFQATVVMIGLFVLRCIVPLLLTVALGHLMNRLLDRWAAEEAQHGDGTLVPLPSTEGPSVPPAPASELSPSLSCWLLRNCSDEQRANCPAYRRQGIPCWQARLIAEGRLPEGCPTCPKYTAVQALT